MANVTLGAAGLNQPEQVEKGINAAICRISLSATTSAGDVLRIGKLPHRAIPLEVVFYPGPALVTNLISKFGLSGSDACFLGSDTYSTGLGCYRGDVNLQNLTAVLSKSDEAPQRYTYIVETPTDVVTVGYRGTLVVFYKMPGQAL
jgi:hypothetical protein